jgi:hypothetical protein
METKARVGLCLDCRHARRVPTSRTIYWLCERAATDPSYAKYPRLPVTACPGYEPEGKGDPPEAAGRS